MKKTVKVFIIIICFFVLTSCQSKEDQILKINNINMKFTSPAFANDSNLPAKYSCTGQGINPELQIADVPINTQSLALIFDDPDAPINTFVHWLVWNIDPKTTVIAENSVPGGATLGSNSARKSSYFPPCPPSGTHRYIFKLYALDIKLDLASGADKKSLEKAMQGHILDSAELIGLFKQ